MAVQPLPPQKKLVVIEESLIISMANDKRFTKEFPFLSSLATYNGANGGGCGGCGKGSSSDRAVALTSAKQTLAGMGDNKKRKLKELLNAKQIRITYRMGSKTVQHTFQ